MEDINVKGTQENESYRCWSNVSYLGNLYKARVSYISVVGFHRIIWVSLEYRDKGNKTVCPWIVTETLLFCFQLLFLFAPVATIEFLYLYLIKEFLFVTYKRVVMQVFLFITTAMYWYNYEHFKKILCKELGTHEPTFFIAFASGAASGSVSTYFYV